MKSILSAAILSLGLISGIDFASAETNTRDKINDIANPNQTRPLCKFLGRC